MSDFVTIEVSIISEMKRIRKEINSLRELEFYGALNFSEKSQLQNLQNELFILIDKL